MTAEQFFKQVLEEIKTYSFEKVEKYFIHLKDGDGRDKSYYQEVQGIYNGHECPFYPFIACAARLSKSKDAVELGADRGASAIFIQSEIPGNVYSVDLEPRSWGYIPEDMKRVIKIHGSSSDPNTLSKYNLLKAKFWLIDSEHTDEQLYKELALYKEWWQKGTIVFCDDIRDTYRAWQSIPYNKYEDLEGKIHGNGTGVFIV